MRQGSDEQLPTVPVSIAEIMASPLFERGVKDARAGRGFPPDYDILEDKLWAYERGRQWARLAPRSLPLKVNGKLNPQALRHYGDDIV